MAERTIRVIAPSRLHFGMLSFGQPTVRQFGGVGAMIDAPGLELTIVAASQCEAVGPAADRALQFAQRALRHLAVENFPPFRIEIVRGPREHAGLGSGTQLGMAVAAGVHRWLQREATPEQWARSVGRGERSAIGVHGFAQGGLLVEPGKWRQGVSPLVARVKLPEAWRFVLLASPGQEGLSGEVERQAFERLPPVPVATSEQLCREVLMHLLPAAAEGDFDDFSQALYRYGHLAGSCFVAAQGGAFANRRLERLVAVVRELGVAGVGQSSWGPTLFALLPNAAAAEHLVARLREHPEGAELELIVAEPNNVGARIEVSA